jgi:hypothetical protein
MTMLNRAKKFAANQHSSVIVESAICLPVFFLLLFFAFELAYDGFIQAVLQSTLAATAQQVEVGKTTAATSADFVANYVCSNDSGLLNCNSLYIRVQTYSPTQCKDFYGATAGAPPVSAGVIDLFDYIGTTAGIGGTTDLIQCSTSGTTPFCDALPEQQIILSAAYLAPSFLQRLLPNAATTYNGHIYHVAYETISFETEDFSVIGTEPAPCPAST